MFAVLGITGNVGGAVAETLLSQGKTVRGIVRDVAKAESWAERDVELVAADYDERLVAAFSGVEGVFAMIPPNLAPEPGFPDSVARIEAIKQAVMAAKPPRAVFLSSIGSEKASGLGLITPTHFLEQELGDTGVPTAFLRAGSFMENISNSVATTRATGKYFAFLQPLDFAFPQIATRDIGRIGAETLLEDWAGKRVLELSGPREYSSNDVAEALGQALGRPIEAVALPRAAWVETMAQIGLPADRSWAYLEMLDGINSGWIGFGAPGVEAVRGTVDLTTAVRAFAAS